MLSLSQFPYHGDLIVAGFTGMDESKFLIKISGGIVSESLPLITFVNEKLAEMCQA